MILQPTSPLRTSQHIDESINLLINSNCDSVVSVCLVPGHFNPYWQFIIEEGRLRLFTGQTLSQIITRRQSLPKTYTRNGAIYAFKSPLVFEKGDIYGDSCVAYIMRTEESINIDSEEDLWLAEKFIIKNRTSR